MPDLGDALTTWRYDPVAAATIAVALLIYLRGTAVARARGTGWPIGRVLAFVAGLALFAAVQFGLLGIYSVEVRWAFSTRVALLLFAVPALLALGRPLGLARAIDSQSADGGTGTGAGTGLLGGADARVAHAVSRMLGSRLVRVTGNAMFATVFAAAVFSLLLTPAAHIARTTPWIGDALTVAVPLAGLLMVIPIVEDGAARTGLFITVEFLLAFAELVLDAVPGIVLRISDTLFDAGARIAAAPSWFPSPMRDQQLSGDLLWFIAEVADVPILVLLFVRWLRSDARDAAAVDELSDDELDALTAEHLARRG